MFRPFAWVTLTLTAMMAFMIGLIVAGSPPRFMVDRTAITKDILDTQTFIERWDEPPTRS